MEYACRNEMCCTVTDLLTLRTRLAYLNSDAALEVAPKVADLMAQHLGWSRSEKKRQLAQAQAAIAEFGGPIPHTDKITDDDQRSAITDLPSLFKTFDLDQNGYLDFQEMKMVAAKLGLPFESEKEAEETFRTNGRGRKRTGARGGLCLVVEQHGPERQAAQKVGGSVQIQYRKARERSQKPRYHVWLRISASERAVVPLSAIFSYSVVD